MDKSIDISIAIFITSIILVVLIFFNLYPSGDVYSIIFNLVLIALLILGLLFLFKQRKSYYQLLAKFTYMYKNETLYRNEITGKFKGYSEKLHNKDLLNDFELSSLISAIDYLEIWQGFNEQILEFLKSENLSFKKLESELKFVKEINNENEELSKNGYTLLCQYLKNLLFVKGIQIKDDDMETIANAVIKSDILRNYKSEEPKYQAFNKIYGKIYERLTEPETLRELGMDKEKIKNMYVRLDTERDYIK